jgi:hypothetical protein
MWHGSLMGGRTARLGTKVREYVTQLRDYRLLFVSGLVLFGPSLILPQLVGSGAVQTCQGILLCTHGTTPWGIATSVFLFDGWANIPVFLGILLMYTAFTGNVEGQERQSRARFTTVVMFGAAMMANMLWLLAKPLTYSWGPSGVIYSMWGVLLAFALFDAMPKTAKSLNPRTWYSSKQERIAAMDNLVVFSSTAIFLFLEPGQFLSAGPGINVFVHGVGFLGGFFSAQGYRWYSRLPSSAGTESSSLDHGIIGTRRSGSR